MPCSMGARVKACHHPGKPDHGVLRGSSNALRGKDICAPLPPILFAVGMVRPLLRGLMRDIPHRGKVGHALFGRALVLGEVEKLYSSFS